MGFFLVLLLFLLIQKPSYPREAARLGEHTLLRGLPCCDPHLLNLSLRSVVLGTWSAGAMWSVKLALHCLTSATTQAEFSGIKLDLLQVWQNNSIFSNSIIITTYGTAHGCSA